MAAKAKKSVQDFETAINEAAPYYIIFGYKQNFGNVPKIVLVSRSLEEVKDKMKAIINNEFCVPGCTYNAYEINSVSSGIVDIPLLLKMNEQSESDKTKLLERIDKIQPLLFRIEETDKVGDALIFESSSLSEIKAQAKDIITVESSNESNNYKECKITVGAPKTNTFKTICILNK